MTPIVFFLNVPLVKQFAFNALQDVKAKQAAWRLADAVSEGESVSSQHLTCC